MHPESGKDLLKGFILPILCRHCFKLKEDKAVKLEPGDNLVKLTTIAGPVGIYSLNQISVVSSWSPASAEAATSEKQIDLLLDQWPALLAKKTRFNVITEPHNFKINPAKPGSILWAGLEQEVDLVVYVGSNAIANVSSHSMSN